MKRSEYEACAARAREIYAAAHVYLTEDEKTRIEVADFGLNRVERVGLQILTYINTPRVCAKEMVLFPGQTCPEHCHVPTNGEPGKEETFRCRFGQVELFVDGKDDPAGVTLPDTRVTAFRRIVLHPGEQFTIMPGVKHWFRGGAEGAVVSEFSTHSTDETDVFTDPEVIRTPVIEAD